MEQPMLNPDIDMKIKADKKRWIILASFSALNFCTTMSWSTFASILSQTSEYYGISNEWAINAGNFIMYGYLAPLTLGSWIIYKKFKYTYLICLFLTALAGWARYVANTQFWVVLVTNLLIGLAQNCYTAVGPLIAERWFPSHERTLAVVVSIIFNYAGWAFGFVFPSLIVDNNIDTIPTMLFVEAIIMSIPLLIGLIFTEDQPKFAANYSSAIKSTLDVNYLSGILKVVKNWRLALTTVSFALIAGVGNSVSSVMQDILPPSFSQFDVGMIGLTFIGTGVIGALGATIYLEYSSLKENYDIIIKVFTLLGTVSVVLAAIFLGSCSLFVAYLLSSLAGLGLISTLPFLFQSLIESSFPIQDNIPIYLLQVVQNALCVVANYISTASFVGEGGIWVQAIFLMPATVQLFTGFKTLYKRKDAEKSASLEKQNTTFNNEPSIFVDSAKKIDDSSAE
jgi:MFS family permease